MADEPFHHILTLPEFFQIHNRKGHPVAKEAGTHRADGAVHHIHKAHPVLARTCGKDFKIAESELVHPDIAVAVNAGNGADIAQTRVLGLFQIYEQSPGGGHSKRKIVYGETL